MDGAQTQPQAQPQAQPQQISPKSRLVALLLVWFFGAIGIHRFYVGKIGMGIVTIVLFVIALLSMFIAPLLGAPALAFLGFPIFFVLIIWVLIDFIRIIVGSYKDKDGAPLKKWTD